MNETFKFLQNYRDNKAELEEVEQLLGEERVCDAVQSASKFPYSKHTVTVEGTPETSSVIQLRKRRKELQSTMQIAEQFVKHLPFRLRKAVQLKYIDDVPERMTWEKIADTIGGGETAASLKNKFRRCLKSDTNDTHDTF